jgi:hypothetical protein
MRSNPRVKILFAILLVLFPIGIAAAQDIEPGMQYVCNGERVLIDSCNIRDTSDTSKCMVGHPDTILPNGLMKYTYETRGDLKKLLPTCKQPSAEEVAKVKAFNKKIQDTQDAQQKKAEADLNAQEARVKAQMDALAHGQTKPQTPEEKALNRCVSSGRPPAKCMGNSLMGWFNSAVAMAAPELAKPLPPGPELAGAYASNTSWRMEFDDGFAGIQCGRLVLEQHPYSVVFTGGHAVLTIETGPKPLVLAMRGDGELAGSGPVRIDGHVVAGSSGGSSTPGHWETHESTNYQTLTPMEAQQYAGDSDLKQNGQYYTLNKTTSSTSYVPGTTTAPSVNYAPLTESCPQPILSSKNAGTTKEGMAKNMLTALFSDGDTGPPVPTGLRMRGLYSAQSGFNVEFFPESAIVACGDAARAYPYTVQPGSSPPSVRIDSQDKALVLGIKANGELDPGSGEFLVHGRRIIGQDDNGDFTFAPLELTCNLGILAPGAQPAPTPAPARVNTASAQPAGAATGAAAPASSAPTAPTGGSAGVANAVLSIASAMQAAQPGGPNLLAGHTMVLLRMPLEAALAKGGFQVPAGVPPFKAVLNACSAHSPDCQKAVAAMNAETAMGIKLDATGKATMQAVAPGTYYVMGSGGLGGHVLLWDVRVELKPGANAISLDQQNSTPQN